MAGRLKLITPPATEPVIPADLRLFGRIPGEVEAAQLEPLIAAAREAAEAHLNRAIITQTWEMVLDYYPCCPISVPLPPLISLQAVTITDIAGNTTTMQTTDFVVDASGCKGEISLRYGKSWPSVTPERAGVVIRFMAGYGDADAVPQRIKEAIIVHALAAYDSPGEPVPEVFYTLLNADRVAPL